MRTAHGLSLPSLNVNQNRKPSQPTIPQRRPSNALSIGFSGETGRLLGSRRISADGTSDSGRSGEYRPPVSIPGVGKGMIRSISVSGPQSGGLFTRRKQAGSIADLGTSPESEARHRQEASSNRLYAGLPSTTNLAAPTQRSTKANTPPIPPTGNQETYSLSDFHRLRTLARDAFAHTLLATLKSDIASACASSFYRDKPINPPTYSIKMFSKYELVQRKLLNKVLRERDVLRRVREEIKQEKGFGGAAFVAELLCTFQEKEVLYVVSEWGAADLRTRMKMNRSMDEDSARFYMAEITLALEFLHDKNIIFRDLKPETIVIDRQGHIKLSDFGLAKILAPSGVTSTFCGSPGYMAPEVLAKSQYTTLSDYWALGILLHELLTNNVPFARNPSPIHTIQLISHLTTPPSVLPLPDSLSPQARDLIRRLLTPLPKDRLGAWYGSEDIKCHVWFRGIKGWRAVGEKALRPPWIPGMDSDVRAVVERRLGAMAGGIDETDEEILDSRIGGVRLSWNADDEDEEGESLYGDMFANF